MKAIICRRLRARTYSSTRCDLGPSLALATDGGHGHVLLQISIPRAPTDGQGEGEGRRQRSRRAAAGRRRVGPIEPHYQGWRLCLQVA